jgi:hypothetical protein
MPALIRDPELMPYATTPCRWEQAVAAAGLPAVLSTIEAYQPGIRAAFQEACARQGAAAVGAAGASQQLGFAGLMTLLVERGCLPSLISPANLTAALQLVDWKQQLSQASSGAHSPGCLRCLRLCP